MDSFYFSSWYIDDIAKKDKSKKSQLQSLQSKLQADAKKHGFSLESKTPEMKQREKKVVCKTFHGAGLVVPVDANDVGYRELPETPGLRREVVTDAKYITKSCHKNQAYMYVYTYVQCTCTCTCACIDLP